MEDLTGGLEHEIFCFGQEFFEFRMATVYEEAEMEDGSNFVEELVELVKSQPFLYDTSHIDYRDKQKKVNVWKSIGEVFNTTGETIQKKFDNLRTVYRRELKKLNQQSGSGAEYHGKWQYFEIMRFLSGGCPSDGNETNIISSPSPTLEDQEASQLVEFYKSRPDSNTSSMETVASSRRGDKRQSDVQTLIKLMEEASKRVASLTPADDEELYGRVITASLRRLSPRNKAIVKVRFQESLLQVEFPE